MTVDGPAISADLKAYNEGGQALRRAFEASPYLTRLYTTLNASEMSVDPSFGYNQDLEDVARARSADLYLDCGGLPNHIITAEGLEVDLDEDDIRPLVARQEGATIRAADTIGAAVIYRPMSAGQPEIISDRRAELSELYRRAQPDDAHGCQQRSRGTQTPWGLIGLLSILFSRVLITRPRCTT